MYKFELTQDEVSVIIEALTSQPFKVVNTIINKLVIDFNKQNAPVPDPVVDAEPPTVG